MPSRMHMGSHESALLEDSVRLEQWDGRPGSGQRPAHGRSSTFNWSCGPLWQAPLECADQG